MPLLLAQLERFVDSGFENLELQYWGLAALRNLCRHKDSRCDPSGADSTSPRRLLHVYH